MAPAFPDVGATGLFTHGDDTQLLQLPAGFHRITGLAGFDLEPFGNAQVADNGHRIVVTTSQYGSVTGKVAVTSSTNGVSWSGFTTVRHSITLGGTERLQVAGSRIMLVGGGDQRYYPPYDWSWSGTSFGNPTSTGDPNDISAIDTTSDASGRLATVDTEVNGLMVSNFASGRKAARFLIPVSDTYAGGRAQISTNAGGAGWVVYSVQRQGVTGQILIARPIQLKALTTTVTTRGKAGRLSLTGPVSCLPSVTVAIKAAAHANRHWKVRSRTLLLNGHRVGGTLNGASLAAGRHYTLSAKATFANGRKHATLRRSLSFTTCARP